MALKQIVSQNNLPMTVVSEDASIFDMRRERQELLLVIKILVGELQQSDPYILVPAKRIIKDCVERNRKGQEEYQHLAQVTKRLLKAVVGDYHWSNVIHAMQVLKSKKNQIRRIKKNRKVVSGKPTKAEIH